MRAALAVLVLALLPASPPPAAFDVVIAGGRVMDPESGLDAVRDIGIRGGTIAVISAVPLDGARRIDARSRVVAPGFVDLHQHSQDAAAYRLKAADGVTTAVDLEAGAADVDRFYAEREGRALIHHGTAASHALLRAQVLTGQAAESRAGYTASLAGSQLAELKRRIATQLARGALAIGMGLEYTPGASPWEVLETFRVAAGFPGTPVHVHVRGTAKEQYWLETEELLAAGLVSGAPVHIVHANSSYGEDAPALFDILTAAQGRGLDVTTECYPYLAGMSSIESAMFDDWQSWPDAKFTRFQWPATGERLDRASFESYRRAGGLVVMDNNTEEALRAAIRSPLTLIASDGILEAGVGHPRAAGSYARVLGRYVREAKLLTLMEALRKMTLMPARRLEARAPAMRNKGRLRVGADADIVVFDPDRVLDYATYAEPTRPSQGFDHVLVGGVAVVTGGEVGREAPGKAVRGPVTPP